MASYPGAAGGGPGFSGAGSTQLHDALGLRTRWHLGTGETAGQLGPVMDAALAVAAGVVDHVVCFRSVWESTAQQGGSRADSLSRGPRRMGGMMEFTAPYGALSASTWVAMLASRYMHDHGLTREQLAQIALTCRRHAAGNPDAVYRDPLSMDDYLEARMISTPLCLYDCDVPADGAVAVIVSRREAAAGFAGRRSRSKRSVPVCTSDTPGTNAPTSPRWRPTTPPTRCGSRRRSGPATSTSWSCTTGSAT